MRKWLRKKGFVKNGTLWTYSHYIPHGCFKVEYDEQLGECTIAEHYAPHKRRCGPYYNEFTQITLPGKYDKRSLKDLLGGLGLLRSGEKDENQ